MKVLLFATILMIFGFGLNKAAAASDGTWITGKIKSFNEKAVVIQQGNQLFELDIKRFKDKSKLKVGSEIKVRLDD